MLKCFNDTTIFDFVAFLIAPSASVTPVRLNLHLNDVELFIVTSALFAGASSLSNNHKLFLPDVYNFLMYQIIFTVFNHIISCIKNNIVYVGCACYKKCTIFKCNCSSFSTTNN